MISKFYKQPGFYPKLFTTIQIILISVSTIYFKTLYVTESGKFNIPSNIGIILSLGLLLKWKYIRQILSIFIILSIYGEIMFISTIYQEYIIAHSILYISISY